MEKRGISPLIATVLLIGFTITIAAILMIWGGNLVKERAEKISARTEAQTSCTAKVEIGLNSAKCTTEDNKDIVKDIVKISVENKGSDTINAFRARINYDGDSETTTTYNLLNPTSQTSLKVEYDTSKGMPKSVIIFPVLNKQSLSYTCSEKSKEIEVEDCL